LLVAALSSEHSALLVRLLLQHGADPNAHSSDTAEMVKNGPIGIGRVTALHAAAAQADYESVAALLQAGASVNAPDIRKHTPLVFAVANDHADPRIVKLLLEKGATREPALPWARRYQNPEVLALLKLTPEKPAGTALLPKPRYDARTAIQKALDVSREPARRMLDTGGCLACHAQHMNGLALAAAKPLGIKADYELEAREARATATLRGALEQQLFQVQDPPPGVDSQQFSLMQMAASAVAPTLATDSLLHHIAAMQRKEGDWPNYGAVRPPLEDGGFNHTANGIRVLRLYPVAGLKAEFDDRVARAAAWLQSHEPRTTEDRAMQVLGLVWAGRKAPTDRVKQLAALQNADGGWAQTPHLAPDAYATGQALYALHEAGMAAADPVCRRGVDFLLRTQQPDGSWHVVTRALAFQPYFQSGFPYDHDQWISQSGTAFATIALALGQ
jgi:hypothetical protein